DVLEASVIDLEDGVLGREVNRVAAVEPVVERCTGEIADRFVEIVHRHDDTGAGRLEHLALDLLAVFAHEAERDGALAGKYVVGGTVLVRVGMTADDDRLGPSRHQARHVAADDRLAGDGAAEDASDWSGA